jgi:hypothetical protein
MLTLLFRRGRTQQSNVGAAPDPPVPTQFAARRKAWQHLLPISEIVGAEFPSLPSVTKAYRFT